MRRFILIPFLLLAGQASAAVAPAVSVSTIAVAGSTVTVTTAAAHNLGINQAFCLTFTPAHCGVIATVPSGTTFTYTQPTNVTVAACAASCGNVSPLKRIIWTITNQDSFGFTVQAYFWNVTASGVLQSGRLSAWPGASAAENSAIAAGNIVERPYTDTAPIGTSLVTEEQRLVLWWTAYQNELAGGIQPGAFNGNYYDTGWLQ